MTSTTNISPEESILTIAERLTNHNRQDDYGHPFDNFTDIGRIWGMILNRPDISPQTVGLMMAGLKIAREKHSHLRDNLIDGAGYFNAIDMCYERISQNQTKPIIC